MTAEKEIFNWHVQGLLHIEKLKNIGCGEH